MADEQQADLASLRVVGMGPVRTPGERRRWKRAASASRLLLAKLPDDQPAPKEQP